MTPERISYAQALANDLDRRGEVYSAGLVRELIGCASSHCQPAAFITVQTPELGAIVHSGGYPHHVPAVADPGLGKVYESGSA